MSTKRIIRVGIDCAETRCGNCAYRVEQFDANTCPVWGERLDFDDLGSAIRLEACRWADVEPLGRPEPTTPSLTEVEELAAVLRAAMDEAKPYVVAGPVGTGRRLALALLDAGYRKEPPPPSKTKPPPPPSPLPAPPSMFAAPFGTIRVCAGCGCLVANDLSTCGRCASYLEDRS